jgi:hypothetical protein
MESPLPTDIDGLRRAVIHYFEVGEIETAINVIRALFALGDQSPAIAAIGVACLSLLGKSVEAEQLHAGALSRAPRELATLAASWMGEGRYSPARLERLAREAGRRRARL